MDDGRGKNYCVYPANRVTTVAPWRTLLSKLQLPEAVFVFPGLLVAMK